MSQTMEQPQTGLLAPTTGPYPGPTGPPQLPNIPGLIPQGMRPTGINMPSEQMMAFLLPPKRHPNDPPPDSDENLPAQLRPYAAGLRPTPAD